MKTWQDLGFQLIQSQDGSPTLRPLLDGQSMHHMGGALAESIFIYDKALDVYLSDLKGLQQPFGVLIVGLGLAYIELLTIKRVILLNLDSKTIFMQSHESQPALVENISRFLQADLNQPEDEVMQTYAQILTEICKTDLQGHELPLEHQTQLQKQVQDLARKLLVSRRWEICGLLDEKAPELDSKSSFHVICFDAYSEKASPELWTELLLDRLIQNFCAPKSVFATYACTGRLTRCLIKAGFISLRSEGFKGKRNSTLMTRGF